MNRWLSDVALLGLVFPYLMSVIIGPFVDGQPPMLVDSLWGMLTLTPISLTWLGVWYVVTQEWRREFISPGLRVALRAVKASWVLLAPFLLIGARRLPLPEALTLAGAVTAYLLLRGWLQRDTRRL